MTTEQQTTETPFRVVVFADFVCPYSYLAVEQIDRIARDYDLQPLWRPHWLHPDTPPEGTPREATPESEAKRERLRAWIQEMAPEQFPRIRFADKRHYSLLAFEALEFAYDCGLDFAYKTAVYDMLWTEGRDIGQAETLIEAAERVGLNTEALKLALEHHLYTQRAIDAVKQAHRIGITSTPTIFLGRTRINGWHYDEVLRSVIEEQGVRPRAAQAA